MIIIWDQSLLFGTQQNIFWDSSRTCLRDLLVQMDSAQRPPATRAQARDYARTRKEGTEGKLYTQARMNTHV